MDQQKPKSQNNLVGELLTLLGRGTVLLIMAGITLLQAITIYQVNSKILSEFVEGRTRLGEDGLTGSFLTALGLGDVSAAESLAFVLALSGIVGIAFLTNKIRKLLVLAGVFWDSNIAGIRKYYKKKLLYQGLKTLPIAVVLSFILAFDVGMFSIQSILNTTEEADVANNFTTGIVQQRNLFDHENTIRFIMDNISNLGGFTNALLIIGFLGLTTLTPVLLEVAWYGFRTALEVVVGPLAGNSGTEESMNFTEIDGKWLESLGDINVERRV